MLSTIMIGFLLALGVSVLIMALAGLSLWFMHRRNSR
jgi:hypothetical protein